ncbi:DEAD/DEAH box helicase [Limnoglobus roseus]|uniref:ATP-dependent helicase n=1 Tax=Limnoglobus roseus TaxID=2598579 RepID=A0A5C1AKR2_9BACT|nr:DEAD/DEAH box helicase [Limnoglobus roseus]QEL19500.1 ATP-dependent helicase [Limnoglobus roseus]
MNETLTEYPRPVPRDYQVEARDAFLSGQPAAIVQLATGLGKTITAGMVFEKMNGRCLFLAHTDELVRQACRAMLRMGIWPNVEKADEYTGGPYLPTARERQRLFPDRYPPNDWFTWNKVVVSSMQTFAGRVEKYRGKPFDLLCIDEAHRSPCRTYRNIHAGLRSFNPALRLLGLTATPYRADKQSLGGMFDEFAYRKTIVDAIADGYLVDIRSKAAELRADATKWTVGGTQHGRDITTQSLRESFDSAECIESIAHPIVEQGEGRKGIVFLPGREACEAVTSALNAVDPGSATFIHGGIPTKTRKRIVADFEDSKFRLLVGCMIPTEGFDVPDVSLVVMARPTGSRGLYEQMLGRGLRSPAAAIEGVPTAGGRLDAIARSAKPDCLVIDFTCGHSKFKLVNSVDVLLVDADAKRSAYVQKVVAPADAADKRKTRDRIEEAEALFELQQSLADAGGPPPRQNYVLRDVDLVGAGGMVSTRAAGPQADRRKPTTKQLQDAHDVLLDPEASAAMTGGALQARIDEQRDRVCGRKAFRFLKDLGVDPKAQRLNWHDAGYLRRLMRVQRLTALPANWPDLVARFRQKRVPQAEAA